MSLSKNLSILFFLSITLCFSLAHAARFDVRNSCPFTVWAAAIPGGGKQLAFGVEQAAFSMLLDVANARPVTAQGFSNAKSLVIPQTPLPNMH